MKPFRFENTILNLSNITHLTFNENDSSVVADNECRVYFTGGPSDPLIIRGAEAQEIFESIENELNSQN